MPLWDMADSTALTVDTSIEIEDSTVTGVGTDFVNEVEIGDVLIINSEEHKVASITNSTVITLETVATNATGLTSAEVARRPTYLNITDARNTFGVDANERAAAEAAGKSGFHAGWVQKHTKQRRYANNDTYNVTWYETLVAAGSMSGDLEDTTFPDATITITTQPAAASANSSVPDTASFSVVATTTSGTITYQWQEDSGSGFGDVSDGGIYSGATASTLEITPTDATPDGYEYRVVLSVTGADNVTSDAAALTVTT